MYLLSKANVWNRESVFNLKLMKLADEFTCLGCCRIMSKQNEWCSDVVKWKQEYPEYIFKAYTALFQYNLFFKRMARKILNTKGDLSFTHNYLNQDIANYFNTKNQKKINSVSQYPISQNEYEVYEDFNQSRRT